jgi:hypothetical protein
MFGFLKRKKKDAFDARPDRVKAAFAPEESAEDDVPEAPQAEIIAEESGYFLSDRDIKIIINACVFFAKNGGDEKIVNKIPEIGAKLREKSELGFDDIPVISACLQAYNGELSRVINEEPTAPIVKKLYDEKVYFLTIIEKLTKYLST